MKLQLEIEFVKGADGALTATVNGVKALGDAADDATRRGKAGTDGLTKAMRDAYVQVMALKEAFDVIKQVVERGFEFNAELQKGQLLSAAMLSNYQAIYDAHGKLVTGADKFNAAMSVTSDLQEKMLIASLKYGVAYGSIAETAQTILATSQGQVKSMDQLVELSVKLSKVGTLQGMQPFQVMRDTRDMLTTGRMTTLSLMLGISSEDLQKAKQGGDVVDFLNQKLDIYMTTAQKFRTTLPGALGAFKNAWDQALGQGTAAQTTELTKMLNDLVDQIVVFDKEGHAAFDPKFIASISAVADAFMGIARVLAIVAELIAPITRGFSVMINLVGASVSWIAEQVMTVPEHLNQTIADMLNGIASQVQKHPFLAKLLGTPDAGDIRVAAGFFSQNAGDAATARETFTNMKDQYSDKAAAAVNAFGPAAQLANRARFGQGPPPPPDEAQLRALAASQQRIAVMGSETDIAQTQAKLAADKLDILNQQLAAEKAIRDVNGLTAADQEKSIAQLQTIYQLADQYLTAVATANKQFDQNQKDFDKASGTARSTKNLAPDQRDAEIDAARELQKQKDEAAQAQLNLSLAQVRAKIADNETKITQDFLDEVAKRNNAQLAGTVESIKAQAAYDNRYFIAQKAMYNDIAQSGAKAVEQGLTDVFNGGNLRNAAHAFVDDLHKSLATMLTTDVKDFLDRLAATASGQKRYNPTTGQYETPSPQEQKNAGYAMTGLQSAAALYGLYQSGQQPGTSRTSNVISGATEGAAIGAAVGGAFGAIMGAIIGGIAGALLTKNKPWYTVSVSGGKISVQGQDANATDVSQAVAQINQSITQGQAAIDGIFAAFPTAIAQGLQQKSLADILQGGSRKFNDATLKQFEGIDIQKMFLAAYTPVIEQGLSDLGVSDPRIQQLIAEAKTKDPTAAFQFITDYVTAFVKLQDYVAFIGKSGADKTSTAVSSLNKTPADQLSDINAKILALTTGFSDLTSDQQIARVQQINTLTDQRYQIELAYLNDIVNAQKTIRQSIAQQVFGMQVQDAGRAGGMALINSKRADILTQIGQATTPQQVADLAQQYQTLTGQLYTFAVAVRDDFQSLLDGFQALADLPGKDAQAAKSPVQQVVDLTARIQELGTNFASLSSEDQITRGKEILDLANQRYTIEKAEIQKVIDLTKSIGDSVDQQIFSIQQQGRTPQQQLNADLARQRELFDKLKNAKSADEVNSIMSNIESGANDIFRLEGPNGAQSTIDMLNAAKDLSLSKLHEFGTALTDSMGSTQKTINDVTATIQKSFNDASDAVDKLRVDLVNFGDAANAQLQKLAADLGPLDDVISGPLNDILTKFGGSLDDVNSGLVGIGGPDGDLDRFANGLGAATDALNAFTGSLGSRGGLSVGGNVLPFRAPDPIVLQPVVQVQLSGSAEAWTQSVATRASVIVRNGQAQVNRAASRLAPATGGL